MELKTPAGGGTASPGMAHSCSYFPASSSTLIVGDPAVRLVEFVAAFQNRSSFQTICTDDKTAILNQIAQLLAAP